MPSTRQEKTNAVRDFENGLEHTNGAIGYLVRLGAAVVETESAIDIRWRNGDSVSTERGSCLANSPCCIRAKARELKMQKFGALFG